MAGSVKSSGEAGQYWVAFELSRRGYVVAVTLAGAQGFDLLVANPSSGRVVGIQVKTVKSAVEKKTDPANTYWAWPVGRKMAAGSIAKGFIALVDLKGEFGGKIKGQVPDVYILPAAQAQSMIHHYPSGYWLEDITLANRGDFLGRWDLVSANLD